MKPPAFQFYADDFIAGVADMTQNEVGSYIMLLAHGWNTHGLKADDLPRLKILAKGEISEHVLGKFQLKNGKLFNKRQEKERKKQADFRVKQKENGLKGGRPKSKAKENPSLSSGESQNEAKKSSPSPSPLDRENSVELPAGFPKTESEAKTAAQFVGCPESFAIETWNKAMGRHGRDAKDIPIRSWQHYLKSEHNFQKNRTEKEKMYANSNTNRPDRNAGTFNTSRTSEPISKKIR